ncbi:MAG: PUA domain-containing protein [Thermoprotei archaeon]
MPYIYEDSLLLRKVAYLLDFMYDPPVGHTLISHKLHISFSNKTKRPKAIYSDGALVAVRRKDGYFLLEKYGLNLLRKVKLSKVVVVDNIAKPFIKDGKDVFCHNITRFVGQHYVGEDTIVVSTDGEILGCGQLILLPSEVKFFKRGVAVKIRVGLGDQG